MSIDSNAARDRAVAAVREFYAVDHERLDHAEAGTNARDAVEFALRAGITHRQIASLAGVPGLLVVRLIEDPEAQVDALKAERHAADRYSREVMDTIRHAAVRLVDPEAGRAARGVRTAGGFAARAGVDRMTVLGWLGKR